MGCGATGEDEDLSDGDAAGSDVDDEEEDEDEGEDDDEQEEEEEEQHQAKVSEIGMQNVLLLGKLQSEGQISPMLATYKVKHLKRSPFFSSEVVWVIFHSSGLRFCVRVCLQ